LRGALFNNQQSIGVGTEAGAAGAGCVVATRRARVLVEFQRKSTHTTLVWRVL